MSRFRLIERGRTPEGIAFCILESTRGERLVSIDIESVWKVQTKKQQRNAVPTTSVGGTPYHKRSSKLRGAA